MAISASTDAACDCRAAQVPAVEQAARLRDDARPIRNGVNRDRSADGCSRLRVSRGASGLRVRRFSFSPTTARWPAHDAPSLPCRPGSTKCACWALPDAHDLNRLAAGVTVDDRTRTVRCSAKRRSTWQRAHATRRMATLLITIREGRNRAGSKDVRSDRPSRDPSEASRHRTHSRCAFEARSMAGASGRRIAKAAQSRKARSMNGPGRRVPSGSSDPSGSSSSNASSAGRQLHQRRRARIPALRPCLRPSADRSRSFRPNRIRNSFVVA